MRCKLVPKAKQRRDIPDHWAGEVATQLDQLNGAGLTELRDKWCGLHGSDPPRTMSPQLLRLALGYAVQEKVLGGLSRQALLRIKSMTASDGKAEGRAARHPSASPQMKAGTKFLREWQGQTHEVLVLENGRFAYAGKTHRSLTTIARLITGTHQSGPKFFGLKVGGSLTMGRTDRG